MKHEILNERIFYFLIFFFVEKVYYEILKATLFVTKMVLTVPVKNCDFPVSVSHG